MEKQKGVIGLLQSTGRMGAMQEAIKTRAANVARNVSAAYEHKASVKKLMSPKKGTKKFDPTC